MYMEPSTYEAQDKHWSEAKRCTKQTNLVGAKHNSPRSHHENSDSESPFRSEVIIKEEISEKPEEGWMVDPNSVRTNDAIENNCNEESFPWKNTEKDKSPLKSKKSHQVLRKRSSIWLHFSLAGEGKAECDVCRKTLSFKNGSTSNLLKHVKSVHPTIEMGERSSSGSLHCQIMTPHSTLPLSTDGFDDGDSSDTSDQAKIRLLTGVQVQNQQKITNSATRPLTLNREGKITNCIFKMMFKDLQPCSIIQEEGFRELLAEMEPSYQIPSTTVFRDFLDENYEHSKQAVVKILQDAKDITLTVEKWTSTAAENYMAVTAHFIDLKWIINSVLLACFLIPEGHEAVTISSKLRDVVSNYSISEKTIAIVTDNAADVVTVAKRTEWDHLLCLAQTLNLVAQAAFLHIEVIHKKVKRIVEYFYHSDLATEKLRFEQAQITRIEEPLELINDVKTRWKSSYCMFERLCAIRESVEAALRGLDSPVDMLHEEEWNSLQECCFVLKPFEVITTELSAEKTVIISKVIPLVVFLRRAISKISVYSDLAKIVKASLVDGLNARFERFQYNSICAKATFLDPRYKNKVFDDTNAFKQMQQSLQSDVSKIIKMLSKIENANLNRGSFKDAEEQHPIWGELDFDLYSDQSSKESESSIEIRQYIEEKIIPRQHNPLEWWKSREVIYPSLSKLARKYLGIVANSVPCERVFSAEGLDISEKRSRIKGDDVQKILFLNANWNNIQK